MNLAQAYQYAKILRMTGDDKKVRLFEVRIQQKIAFPFLCVVLAIIGTALGSAPQYISKGTSLSLSVLIVFTYYIINFLTGSLGIAGVLNPFWSAWLPNFLGLGVGIWLLRKMNG